MALATSKPRARVFGVSWRSGQREDRKFAQAVRIASGRGGLAGRRGRARTASGGRLLRRGSGRDLGSLKRSSALSPLPTCRMMARAKDRAADADDQAHGHHLPRSCPPLPRSTSPVGAAAVSASQARIGPEGRRAARPGPVRSDRCAWRRSHDIALQARIAGYRRGWCEGWLYGDDRQLIELYNKSLNILPLSELPHIGSRGTCTRHGKRPASCASRRTSPKRSWHASRRRVRCRPMHLPTTKTWSIGGGRRRGRPGR